MASVPGEDEPDAGPWPFSRLTHLIQGLPVEVDPVACLVGKETTARSDKAKSLFVLISTSTQLGHRE